MTVTVSSSSVAGRTGRCMHWCVALVIAGLVSNAHAGTKTIEGRVVGISDGDTITLLDADNHQHKIRLDGIDAPESRQPFGRASKAHLSALLANRDAVAECHKTDRYGREVCRVLVAGLDVCLAQVEAGMAWHFKRYASEQAQPRRAQYGEAEQRARAERRGLWFDDAPIPPWDWRQN